MLLASLPPLDGGAPLTRFAPAPTGYLHLGHVVNAVYVWAFARAAGGRVLLRMEDHDRQRSRPAFERALLEDLDWLGFQPDVHPTDAYRDAQQVGLRQSERDTVYRQQLAPLIAAGQIYGCDCSRAALDRMAPADDGERRYPGTCRDRQLPLDGPVGWRLRLPDEEVRFDDALLGPQRQRPAAQCGDLLLRDRIGNWTYQCAVTIDDHVQAIGLVVRGRDLLASTGRQILFARLLGRSTPPRFAHHPLVMRTATEKLSKSDGAAGVRELRARGWSPSAVIDHAMAQVGAGG